MDSSSGVANGSAHASLSNRSRFIPGSYGFGNIETESRLEPVLDSSKKRMGTFFAWLEVLSVASFRLILRFLDVNLAKVCYLCWKW